MTLEKDNKTTFYYYTLAPRMRTPILDTDTEIVGFALPNADIEIAVGDKVYMVKANGDGYFNQAITAPSAGASVTVKVNGKSAESETVQTQPSGDYIIDGTVIRRYLGEGGNITLPVSAGESGSITEIGDFAFYGSNLTSVILPDTITYVHKTAFDGNAAEDARFVITSDAAEITPTEGYDVRRTSGLLNKWTKTYLDLLDSFKNTIQIEKTEGTEVSTALIISNKDDNGGELPKLAIYVAKYNSNKLETVNKIEFADDAGSKAAIIPKQTGDYNIFIWTDNMQPVINPITSETNEPNKLF